MVKIPHIVAIVMLVAVVGAAARQTSNTGALPPAVRAAFTKAYPKAVIDRWAAEQRDGAPVFEVESHEGTQKRDLLYAANGELIEFEEALPVGKLPAAVRQAVSKAYPRATVESAERLVRGHVIEYEVLLKGANVKEVLLSSGGVILKTS